MKNLFNFFLINISIIFVGCSAPLEPQINMREPIYVKKLAKKEPKESKKYEGSLFGRGENPLFADKKAMKKNDIVTVVIDENTIQLSQGKKKLSDTTTSSIGGGIFTGDKLSKLNKYTDIGFQTNSSNTFAGSGVSTRNEKFSTTISARIVKVLENGNYYISGSRELLINGDKQIIKISGVIRPYDIDQSNTINSKYIADARILYQTQGDIHRSTNEPWGTKIVKTIMPF